MCTSYLNYYCLIIIVIIIYKYITGRKRIKRRIIEEK